MELNVKDFGAVMDAIAAEEREKIMAEIEALSDEHQATWVEGFAAGILLAGRKQFASQLAAAVAKQAAIEAAQGPQTA